MGIVKSATLAGALLTVWTGTGAAQTGAAQVRNTPPLPNIPQMGGYGPVTAPNVNYPSPSHSSWVSLGPTPLLFPAAQLGVGIGATSGRLTGIAVDPTNSSNIYVASAGGGVWQSTDAGISWNPLTDTQSALSMGAIAIAPTNHLRIYAGTGEANNNPDANGGQGGQGILVSTDGGVSWTLSTGPSGVFLRHSIAKISVDPTNELIAYAAVSAQNLVGLPGNTGIYKTTNGGTNWVNVTAANSPALDSTYPWSDVVVDPNTPTIIYAAHGDPNAQSINGVYRSTTGGASWSLLSNAPNGTGIGRIALAVAKSASTGGSHALYVAIATVTAVNVGSTLYQFLVSNNADNASPTAVTFANRTSTPNFGGSGGQGWYDWVIEVDPANALNVYAAGAADFVNNQTHAVIRSTDGGVSWTDITTVGGIQPHTDSHAMAFDSSSRLLLGNDGGIWRFDPGGLSWTNLNGNLNTIQFTGIGMHPTNSQTFIGGSQDNGTELATGNIQWSNTIGGDGGFSYFDAIDPMTAYAYAPPATTVQVSTDGGNTFSAGGATGGSNFNFYFPVFVDPKTKYRVFIGGNALYESTSAGASWTTHASPAAAAIDSIAVLPGGNTIYIATGGSYGATSQIWVSTNDGSSWTQHSLPVAGRVNELDIDPNDSTGNTVIAVINRYNSGNGGQIYRTTTGGSSWTNISGNAAQIPTWSAKIDTDANQTIYIGNDLGVYSSPSPYGTWTAVGTGLPHAQAVDLELNTTTHVLAVATHGRGAWYYSTVLIVAPTISKAFSPTSINPGGTSTVTLTLTNSNSTALSGGAFTDTLVNMSAVAGTVGGTCGASPANLSAGATNLSFSGIAIAASSSCTVTFGVTSSTFGGHPNTTSGVSTTQAGTGSTSNTATLTVLSTAPPTTDSVSPTSGVGSSQLFTFHYSSVNGASYLNTVSSLINSTFSAANGCYINYSVAAGTMYLFNDAGTAVVGSTFPGSTFSVSNSQCTLYGTNSSASSSGNGLTLSLLIAFKGGFAGQKNVYGNALDNASRSSGWITLGTWNAASPAPPTVNSVSPASGAGLNQTFTFSYSSSGGSGYLQGVYALFDASTTGINGCYVSYLPGTNALSLRNDTNTAILGPITPGSSGTLSNTQCTLNGTGSSVSQSGNTLTLAISISFKPAFTGTQNIYGAATDLANNGGTWQLLGTWTPNVTAPVTVSVTPSSGSGSSQVFTAVYSDTGGFGYLNDRTLLIATSLSGAGACMIQTLPSGFYLMNDAGSGFSGPLNGSGTLSNSQCTLNGSGSSISNSGNNSTVVLAVTFTVPFTGAKNVYMNAGDTLGNHSAWALAGTYSVVPPAPTADSVSPSTGSGLSQIFTFKYSSAAGWTYLSAVQSLINGSLNGANGCFVYSLPGSNLVYLYNDAGTTLTGPLTPGSAATLSNSQCTVNGTGSTMSGTVNTVTVALSITFKPAFYGAKNVYGNARDNIGSSSGFQALGAYTVAATAPTSDSVSPATGVGSNQTFTFKYSSAAGWGFLSAVQSLINGTLNGANGCFVYTVPGSNLLYLYNDTGATLTGPLTLGSASTLSNSQCTVNGSGSSVSGTGNTVTLALSITFKVPFTGAKNVYGYATDSAGSVSGWQALGTYSVAPLAPTADSVSPNAGAGSSQVFTLKYSSAAGWTYLSAVQSLINGTLNGANACFVYTLPGSNLLYLYNDAGTALTGPLTLGSASTLSNSQCTVNGSGSSMSGTVNTLTLALSITFKASFTGSRGIYGNANDYSGSSSGWQALGTYTVGPSAPTADSVSPNAGAGSSQVFTLKYSSAAGWTYLSAVQSLINASLNGANACFVYTVPGSNLLYLYNDAGTALTGPLTLGSASTLSNSQCTVNGSGSSVSGTVNTLTLALSITFKVPFTGSRSIYGNASDYSGSSSGWQSLGAYTVTPLAPTADSVSPNAGTGSSQVFTLKYSSAAGWTYLSAVQSLINGSLNGANACFVYTLPGSNLLYLYNDAGTALTGPLTLGSVGTLSNSQCTVNGSGSLVSGTVNTLTLALSITFKASFTGSRSIYGNANDYSGSSSGWQSLGAYTVTPQGPTADSVSPNTGTGSSQVFTFNYSSAAGWTYLSAVQSLISGTLSGANGCFVYTLPGSSLLYLYNDAGTALTGPLTPRSAGTLSNSQCTLNGFGSAVSGTVNTLTLTLSITFKAPFTGLKNLYGYASDYSGSGSGWQTLGTWSP